MTIGKKKLSVIRLKQFEKEQIKIKERKFKKEDAFWGDHHLRVIYQSSLWFVSLLFWWHIYYDESKTNKI